MRSISTSTWASSRLIAEQSRRIGWLCDRVIEDGNAAIAYSTCPMASHIVEILVAGVAADIDVTSEARDVPSYSISMGTVVAFKIRNHPTFASCFVFRGTNAETNQALPVPSEFVKDNAVALERHSNFARREVFQL